MNKNSAMYYLGYFQMGLTRGKIAWGLRASSLPKCKKEPLKIKKEPLKIVIDCNVTAYSMLQI